MSEGTKVVDTQAEIAELRERVAKLERQMKLLARRFTGPVTVDEMRAAGFEV